MLSTLVALPLLNSRPHTVFKVPALVVEVVDADRMRLPGTALGILSWKDTGTELVSPRTATLSA